MFYLHEENIIILSRKKPWEQQHTVICNILWVHSFMVASTDNPQWSHLGHRLIICGPCIWVKSKQFASVNGTWIQSRSLQNVCEVMIRQKKGL